MSSAIQNMLENVIGDGARSTKFDVLFEFTDVNTPSAQDVQAMVKTTSLPSKSHTTIDFKYKGRSIPLRGQTKYSQTWECTFYLTQDHSLKKAFENWIEALDEKHNYAGKEAGVSDLQDSHNLMGYTTTINIYQKDFDDKTETAKYELYNVFPTEVSAVQYDYSASGQIQEFTVIFAYSHFGVSTVKGQAGNFIDTIMGKLQGAAQSVVSGALTAVGNSINSFVSDAVGNTLNELNDWANGLSTDYLSIKTDITAENLINGGIAGGTNNIFSSIEEQAGKSLSEFGSAINSTIETVQGEVTSAVNSATNAITKIKF